MNRFFSEMSWEPTSVYCHEFTWCTLKSTPPLVAFLWSQRNHWHWDCDISTRLIDLDISRKSFINMILYKYQIFLRACSQENMKTNQKNSLCYGFPQLLRNKLISYIVCDELMYKRSHLKLALQLSNLISWYNWFSANIPISPQQNTSPDLLKLHFFHELQWNVS